MVLKRAVAYDAEALDAIFALVEVAQKTDEVLLSTSWRGLRRAYTFALAERQAEAIDKLLALITDSRHMAYLQAHFQAATTQGE